MEMFPSYGGAPFREGTIKVIRLILRGCTNRPFFHISIQENLRDPIKDPVIEQIGSFDPLPNQYNEKLVAINFKRLDHWLVKGARPTEAVSKLLGLCGYFPIHSASLKNAYQNRKFISKELEKLKIEAAKISLNESSNSGEADAEVNLFSSETTSENSDSSIDNK